MSIRTTILNQGDLMSSLFCLYIGQFMNIAIPKGTKRIVLVSNIEQPPAFTFEEGDLIVEMNRAVHHKMLLEVLGDAPLHKFLFVRHSKEGHFFPSDFNKKSRTWDNIILGSERFGFSTEDWFVDYFKATNEKTPTTGFGLYKFFRSRRPNMQIIGLGFDIDDHTTPHSQKHDWEYEYEVYKKDKHFTALA